MELDAENLVPTLSASSPHSSSLSDDTKAQSDGDQDRHPETSLSLIRSPSTLSLSLECRKCNLKFRTPEELANHLDLFCRGAKYGDADSLKQSILESAGPKALSIDDIRKFLSAGAGPIGSISLSDLRSRFRADAASISEVKTEVLQSRQAQLIDDLRQLKRQHGQIRFNRVKQQAQVQKSQHEVDTERQREIRSRIERERLRDILQRSDQVDLESLEAEKRREVAELSNERELLQKKEADALAEIERLAKLLDKNQVEQPVASASSSASEAPRLDPNDIRMRFARSGQQLGEEAGLLRADRQQKLLEREQIHRRLEAVAKRPDAQPEDEQQCRALIEKLKADQGSSVERLEKMRSRLASEQKQKPIDDRPPPSSSSIDPIHIDNETDIIANDDEGTVTNVPFGAAPDLKEPSSPLPCEQPEPVINLADNANIEEASTLAREPKSPPARELERMRLIDEIARLKKDLQCAQERGHHDDGNTHNEPAPDRDRRHRQDHHPEHFCHDCNGSRDPLVMAASTSPLILQLQQQMAQTQMILQQHQAENARLYSELAEIESTNESGRFEQQRRDIESTLHLVSSRMAPLGTAPAQSSLAPAPDPDLGMSGSYAPPTMRASAARPRADLGVIPRDSELFRLEIEHQTKLARVRFQKELQAEEFELAQIRQDAAQHAKKLDDDRRHAEYLEEQRRRLEKQQMRQELARDLPLADFKVPTMASRRPYNPLVGFTIIWDFVYGLDRSQTMIRLVYQIMDGGSPKLGVEQSEKMQSQPDGPSPNSNRICICGSLNTFTRLPPLPSLKLLVEVQVIGATSDEGSSLGWTLIELFDDGGQLRVGLWRFALYTCSIRKELAPGALATALGVYRHPTAILFVRLLAADDAAEPGGDPNLVLHLYSDQSNPIPATNESRRVSGVASYTSRSVSLNPIEKKPVALNPSTRTPSFSAIEMPLPVVAIAIRSAELPSTTYSRVRTSLVHPPSLEPLAGFIWTSPYAQVGADGNLGVFRWEASCIFRECPIADDGALAPALLLEVLTRADRPLSAASVRFEVDSTEMILGWALVDDVARSKLGPITLGLAAPPITWPKTSPALVDANVQVELFDVDLPPDLHPVNLLIDTILGAGSLLPWIDTVNTLSANAPSFEHGDGFDVYVDQCRFLPDSVLLSRVTLNVWTSDVGAPVVEPASAVCMPGSSVGSPKYDLRQEFRSNAFDPTCTIEIVVDAIEASSLKLKLVGVAVINVFEVRGSHKQPSHTQQQDFCLNAGCFQLPLHAQLVRGRETLLASSYDSIPSLPCATVLVRIVSAVKSPELGEVLSTKTTPERDWIGKGLVIAAPTYSTGSYDSSRCRPSAMEAKLYNILARKEMVLVETILNQINDYAEDVATLPAHVVRQLIGERLAVATPAPIGSAGRPAPIPSLSLARFAHYQPSIGLRLAIDVGYYLGDGHALPFAVYSLSPPADFYKPFGLTEDVHLTGQWDWNSYLRWPIFTTEYTNFKDVAFNEFLVAIIDVRLLRRGSSLASTVIEPLGWTVLQLFDRDGFVATGSFQLPLLKGLPLPDVLTMMAAEDAGTVIAHETTKAAAKRRRQANLPPLTLLEPESVVVRLADGQIGDLAPTKFQWRTTELLYANFERRDRYECDLDSVGRGGGMLGLGAKPQKLASLRSPKETLKQLEATTMKTIATKLGIETYNT